MTFVNKGLCITKIAHYLASFDKSVLYRLHSEMALMTKRNEILRLMISMTSDMMNVQFNARPFTNLTSVALSRFDVSFEAIAKGVS